MCGSVIKDISTDYNPITQMVHVQARCHGKEYHDYIGADIVKKRHHAGLPIILEFGDEKDVMGAMDASKAKFEVTTTPGKRLITLNDDEE